MSMKSLRELIREATIEEIEAIKTVEELNIQVMFYLDAHQQLISQKVEAYLSTYYNIIEELKIAWSKNDLETVKLLTGKLKLATDKIIIDRCWSIAYEVSDNLDTVYLRKIICSSCKIFNYKQQDLFQKKLNESLANKIFEVIEYNFDNFVNYRQKEIKKIYDENNERLAELEAEISMQQEEPTVKPKITGSLKPKAVVDLLEEDGWEFARHGKGSHDIYKKDGQVAVVSNHGGDVKKSLECYYKKLIS